MNVGYSSYWEMSLGIEKAQKDELATNLRIPSSGSNVRLSASDEVSPTHFPNCHYRATLLGAAPLQNPGLMLVPCTLYPIPY